MTMQQIDLSRADLNLLVVFDALMRERHVGRAAKRLYLSQSATSHALGRLRDLLGDPLFVRHPRGVEPTARALDLADAVTNVLAGVSAIVRPPEGFDPARLSRTFRVSSHDFGVATILAPVIPALLKAAPNVDLRIRPIDSDTLADDLDRGRLDLALCALEPTPQRILRTPLFQDELVGVARRGHPEERDGRMSLDAFVELPHAEVSWSQSANRLVDDVLEPMGLSHRVAVTVNQFLALPFVIAGSDLICLVPRRAAVRMAETQPLALFELPVKLPPLTFHILTSRQLEQQPDLAWFCRLLASHAGVRESDQLPLTASIVTSSM